MSRCLHCATCFAVGLLLLTTTVSWGQRGGFDRGGDRGGDRGRGGGGPPFGRGGGGPPRMGGGFDPTFILRRMDRNENGQLDSDEIDDRARFMINRFAPDVDLSKPVKIEAIAKSVRERTGGGDRDRGGSSSNEAPVIETLVPGFGLELDLSPIPGFGDLAALFDIETTEADEKEAEGTLRRYDRNQDGLLNSEELRRGRWYDEPLQYDQNGDGSLSQKELVIRYAIRRVSRAPSSSDDKRRRDRGSDKDKDKKAEEGDSRNSYRFLTAHERLPEGTPAWFIEKDRDQDGQVTMFEFASQWNDSTANQFLALDQNGDGIVTVPESLTGESNESTRSDADTTASVTKTASATKRTVAASSGSIPEKYLKYAREMIEKYDKDENGNLSSSEASAITEKRYKPTDWNGDGKITVEEFAKQLMKKK